MALVLYCVVERPPERQPSGLRTIGDGPALLVRDVADPPKATLDALKAHHEVTVAAARRVATLPFRFGETLADDNAARAWLAAHESSVRGALDRVRDRWEFDLKAPTPPQQKAPTGPGAGTRYLESLAARPTDERLAAVAVDARARLAPDDALVDAGAGQVAFLVRKADAPSFAKRARDWSPGEGWHWSGPWPAYSFAAAWLAI